MIDYASAGVNTRFAAAFLLLLCVPGRSADSAPEAFARAAKALQAHDFTTAAGAIHDCLKLDPQYPGASAMAAQIELEVGLDFATQRRFQEATKHFRSLTELQPGFAGGHYNFGLALLNLGDAAGAEKAFRRAVKLSPTNTKARSQLAYALLKQARTDRTRMGEAAVALREAARLVPSDPDLRFNLAFALTALHDDAGALSEYSAVLRIDPQYPGAEASVGYTLFQLSNWTAAEQHFRLALDGGRDDYAVHYYLGSTLVKTGNVSEARLQFEKAVALDEEQPAPHFQLASLYRALGDTERRATELKLFRELSERQTTKWRAEALEAAASRALGRGDLAQGIAALTDAYQSRPTAEAARNLAFAWLQKGDLAQAESWLKTALDRAPQDAAAHNYMGLLQARQGRLVPARQHFELAARLDPSLLDAAYNAGVTALELGDTEGAIRYLEVALKGSQEPRFHEALALALSATGRHDEARRHFEAAQKGLE
jgi:Flp pilus assembly protein TadD